jgi:hypothetical protein
VTNNNNPIQQLLEAAYIYYWTSFNNVLSDFAYDRLAKQIEKDWDNLAHAYKGLIDRDALANGTTLFYIPKNSYPVDIKNKYKE